MSPGGFDLGPRRRPRRASLTPMIDVVFLLLVFFMLAARFGVEARLPLTLGTPATEAVWTGPPRLVDVLPEGVRLNGLQLEDAALPEGLAPLTEQADDPVLLRPREGASLQRLVEVLEALDAAGHGRLMVLE